MDRKEFLFTLGRAGMVCAATAAFGDEFALGGTPSAGTFRAKAVAYHHTGKVSAAPEAVFPLLCPIREYEWIEGWKCELIHSVSGVAEEGCIFKTSFADPLNPMTWVCSRYEPPRRIQYVGMVPGEVVMRLDIAVDPAEGGTRLSWTRAYTGLSESGNERVGYWKPEWDGGLTEKIEYFLKTGKALKAGTTPGRDLQL